MKGWLRRLSWKRVASALLLLLALPWAALLVAAALTPLPEELREDATYAASTRILDRGGVVLREVRAEDGTRARWVPLSEVGDDVKKALIAAEDRRFYAHPGIDPLAIGRALAQAIWHRKVVSGASTLTQQLARQLFDRPRTLSGKFREAALALRIERSLSKDRILEQYLNRVSFGPNLRGIEAASRFYFDKPSRELSLAEAAALASMPRGPSFYDPRRHPARLLERRNRILDRMLELGFVTEDQAERARNEPLVTKEPRPSTEALHFGQALLAGKLDERLLPFAGRLGEVRTTLNAALQREVEAHVQRTVRALANRRATAAAVVVVENATGEVLAYVGSHDPFDVEALGANDGVLALRQPGSALKPFVYQLAFEALEMTPATLLPDIDAPIQEAGGIYRPRNYDGRFHGPVRAREALANSYNVPAVHLARVLGPERVLERLRALGFGSLDREASHYGSAIALGDGEVRLLELAQAYATLARGGIRRPLRVVLSATTSEGEAIELPEGEAVRLLDETTSELVAHMLADPSARLDGFGEHSVLELPFPVAVKTGTSKGYRDNLTVGFTKEVTVAVWVGNFDGSPMQGVSGVTGAGPLFHAVMLSAMREREPQPLFDEDRFESVEVCRLSGALPTSDCPHRVREVFARGTKPTTTCDMHERVRIDVRNGLRAGPSCPAPYVEERVFERYDARYAAWAEAASRPLAERAWSPLCPGRDEPREAGHARIVFPLDGSRFELDPTSSSAQTLRIRAVIPEEARAHAKLVINGRAFDLGGRSYLDWPLTPGRHHVKVVPGDERGVRFTVVE